MKNYIKTTITTEPRLVIHYELSAESPRQWDNLGYFITRERNYPSPDSKQNEWIQNIVEETANDVSNVDMHIELITKAINETGETVKVIYPVNRYEHGNVVYSRGIVNNFDYSNCGFYIVTDKTQNVLGTPDTLIEKVIDSELETYTAYANGEVYYYMLRDENGEEIDSCGGFYNIEDIKENLPEEYKNDCLHDYLEY